ncbi:hypothetical protein AAZX31_15G075500 [Glycine max]|uniref:Uncharacterized protein n=1 Tax=Glycine max TaxID=3847 RepID=A0A0R0FXS1_SOYBN|nr:hypothetical protein GYH30_041680 [Glycine max]KRH10942.1 hypothetical protein GLYMA_15G078100v4 [Glycine max]
MKRYFFSTSLSQINTPLFVINEKLSFDINHFNASLR